MGLALLALNRAGAGIVAQGGPLDGEVSKVVELEGAGAGGHGFGGGFGVGLGFWGWAKEMVGVGSEEKKLRVRLAVRLAQGSQVLSPNWLSFFFLLWAAALACVLLRASQQLGSPISKLGESLLAHLCHA